MMKYKLGWAFIVLLGWLSTAAEELLSTECLTHNHTDQMILVPEAVNEYTKDNL